MPTYKRIDGDYNITSINSVDNVVVTTNTLRVLGNLDVAGNLTYINVTELNVTDPFILLNASNTGSYSANSGVLTHITSNTYAGIRYDADVDKWQVSSDTSSSGETGTWANLATGTNLAGGANTDIQFNDGGGFGGNANFTYDYANSRLALNGTMSVAYTAGTPSQVANTTVVYSNSPGSGGTGLYFVNSNQDELVSKSKAIVFSIIF